MMSRLRPSRKARLRAALALAFTAGLLAACSAVSTIDMIPPAAGGLPANVPQRAAAQPDYPAVNDMPQRREALPLTEDEVKRAKTDLTTLRTQQEERTGTLPKPADAAAKKDAEVAKTAKKAKAAKPPTELTSAKDQNK